MIPVILVTSSQLVAPLPPHSGSCLSQIIEIIRSENLVEIAVRRRTWRQHCGRPLWLSERMHSWWYDVWRLALSSCQRQTTKCGQPHPPTTHSESIQRHASHHVAFHDLSLLICTLQNMQLHLCLLGIAYNMTTRISSHISIIYVIMACELRVPLRAWPTQVVVLHGSDLWCSVIRPPIATSRTTLSVHSSRCPD